MQHLTKAQALSQMAFKDHAEPKECFLTQLSQEKWMGLFTQVLLFSSPQDHYVP